MCETSHTTETTPSQQNQSEARGLHCEGKAPPTARRAEDEDEVAARPVVLSLSRCLEATPACAEAATHIGAGLDDLLSALHPFELGHYATSTDQVSGLHEAARAWIATLPVWDKSSPLVEVSLFTDGSFQAPCSASWAVVACGRTAEGPVFVGHMSDVLWPAEDERHLGNRHVDAHAAELAAMFVALATIASCDGGIFYVFGDCTSVLDVVSCYAHSHAEHLLATASLDLHLIAKQRRNDIIFGHVPSHEGHAGNECADSIAKAALKDNEGQAPDVSRLCKLVRRRQLGWLWWTVTDMCSRRTLPGLDDDGRVLLGDQLPLPCFHQCLSIPGIPFQDVQADRDSDVEAQWHVRVATYNANSLRLEADRQALDAMMWGCGVQVIGVQESRQFLGPRTKTARYHCFASQDLAGNLGCQLWIAAGIPFAKRRDGSEVFPDLRTATVVHSSERIIAVCVEVGSLLFGLVSAHAPIDAAPEHERLQWWGLLERIVRRFPRRAVPVMMVDGNARFRPTAIHDDVQTAPAANNNAVSLREFCSEGELGAAPFFTLAGDRVVTWTSPAGRDDQIDYVLWPALLAKATFTSGSPWVHYACTGVDHRPLICQTRWNQPTRANKSKTVWNRKLMATEHGRSCLAAIFQTAPQIPWSFHVEDHMQLLNNHLHAGLSQHFAQSPAKPRQPHISEQQWRAILQRRHARRLAARSRRLRTQELAYTVFSAWKSSVGGVQIRKWGCRSRGKTLLQEARLAVLIRSLNSDIRRTAMQDAAEHVRCTMRHARSQGPAELYGALRSVIKVGRRYKAPRILPVLQVADEFVTDPVEIRRALTAHFAGPEHGVAVDAPRVVELGKPNGEQQQQVILPDGISLAEVMQGFLALRDAKAPGLSSLPAELYKYAALDAAVCMAPVLVKCFVRGCWPATWRGVLSAAIPKPSKEGTKLQSWRAIALAEAAFKGVGKAMRKRLADSLQDFITPGQGGSLPGQQIGRPSQHVMAHLNLALHRNESTAVVMLDGRTAYYSTIRQHLFSHDPNDPDGLDSLLQALVPDNEVRDEVVASLLGPGLLEQAGVSASLEGYLRHGRHMVHNERR